MQQIFLRKSFIVLVFSIVFLGCFTIRPGAVKAGKHLYETFLAGGSKTMYFIKPIDFYNQNGKSSIALDFTFRYTNVIADTAFLKFSIFDQLVMKDVDSIQLQNGSKTIVCSNIKHMFSDRAHKQYANRFEAMVPLSEVKALFENPTWTFVVYSAGSKSVFLTNKKTDKNIIRLQLNVFAVL